MQDFFHTAEMCQVSILSLLWRLAGDTPKFTDIDIKYKY